MMFKTSMFLSFIAGLLCARDTVKQKVDFPCKVCKSLYNTTCQGINPKDINSCATAEQAKVKYYLGLQPTSKQLFIPHVSCTMEMKCPEGTKLAFPMDEYFQNPVI
ncbi:hypothetical protein GCK72_019700 [Caenorhabditis remanei]|uniref:Uncharacterized protein n=1 Tax=Caenorhabditis remanei TaxID=31234 RepID=A0A6A5GEH4_CAERE|nr:hypothetical protein GCK72_019700 [Caenorhabditis remanei]KAF1753144.1 hypothetical protein GCK72_019700 [Caenorhabditis remanei]